MSRRIKSHHRRVDFHMPDWAQPLLKPHRRKVLYGGRGSGKSWAIGAALIGLAHQKPLRIACVRETQDSIRDSAKKNLENMIYRLGLGSYFQVLEMEIRHRNGSVIFFSGLSNVTEESIRGWEDVDIVWVEESHSMSHSSWEILRNTIRKDGSEIWMSFNPKYRYDPAYRDFVMRQQPGAFVRKVNFHDNPWFPKELEINRQEDLRNEPERYAHIWLGEPDDVSSDRKVLPYDLLNMCVEAWPQRPSAEISGVVHCGLDVADTGADRNAIVARRGPELLDIDRWASTHLGQTARRAKTWCLEKQAFRLYFDVGGVGGGIRSHLIDMGNLPFDVRPMNFGGSVDGAEVIYTRGATNQDFFFRKNAQMGWALRLRAEATKRWLDPDDTANIDPSRCLFINPEIRHLEDALGEFSQPEWDENNSGQMVVLKQPSLVGTSDKPPSPDRYDAGILSFAADSQRGLRKAA